MPLSYILYLEDTLNTFIKVFFHSWTKNGHLKLSIDFMLQGVMLAKVFSYLLPATFDKNAIRFFDSWILL